MSTATMPTPAPAAPLMTAEEFLAKHGDESGVELIKGRVVRLPMPGGKHGVVCGMATHFLMQYALEKKAGRVMSNDSFVRTTSGPDSFRGADVCFLSYSRLPKDQETPSGPVPSPDLVIEVKSPHDRVNHLNNKAYEYLEAGVAVVVVLFPETKTAAIYRNEELPVRLEATDELKLPDVLPDFSVRVGAFFE
jgi:Uma2 family endonuclease